MIGGTVKEIGQYKHKYPAVHFLGQLPYYELKHNQQAADVLVIPNTARNKLSALYTSPLKLFAHLTSKKSLLCANIPSLTNVVSDKHVWFFTPDDPVDLARSIDGALKATDVDQKCEQAFNLSKQYTWTARAKNILSFMKS